MIYLKVAGQLTALAIAIFALFGETAKKHKLNRLGSGLLTLVFLAGIFNITSLIVEENAKRKKEIQVITAKKMVYSRLVRDIEAIKHAFTWSEYKLFSDETELFNYEQAPSTFMIPEKDSIKSIDKTVVSPITDSVRAMSLTYDANRNYLAFEEADALGHFLETMRVMNVHTILLEYEPTQGTFADYLIERDLYHDRLKYLFLSLRALEEEMRSAREKNMIKFYELRPECKVPEGADEMFSCM